MARTITKKKSYTLVNTNPKLTGNVKLVVDSNEDIYIETIDGSIELSRNKFKGIKLDINNSWANDVYNLFDGGNIPPNIFYSIKDNQEFLSTKKEYKDQYNVSYQQGATTKISKFYKEQLSYFAPTWFEPNDIPEHFAIFKLKNPVSINGKNIDSTNSEELEKMLYDTNYFSTEEESDYFFETILKNSEIIQTYDLTPNSSIGTYLRNHLLDNNFPESSLTINWNINEPSTVNGLSLNKSGFTKESFNIFDEAFPVDRTITEFDNYVTKKFEDNSVIHPNLINLEFLFDDESDEDYSVNRYFGFYFNKQTISKFKINSADYYYKKYDNLEQNKNITSIDQINILDDDNIVFYNDNGVKLFVDYEGDYVVKSSDIKGQNFIPYIFSTDCKFFDVNNNADWGNNEIILKEKVININEFKGFTKESTGIIPATKNLSEGRSYFEFRLEGSINSLEIRLRDVYEKSSEFNLNRVFIGDTGLDEGTFINNKFSLDGTPNTVLTCISECINNYTNIDEDFNLYSIVKSGKLLVFTRGTNQSWNNYEFLVYSDDENAQGNIFINFGEELISITDYNNERVANGLSKFLDYSAVVTGATSMYYDPDSTIIQSTLIGGNDNADNKIKVDANFFQYFSDEQFLKTKEWYSPIISVSSYLDQPVFQNGRIVDFTDYDLYFTVNSDDNILITKGGYCEIYDIADNEFGLMSLYGTRQFDIDQFRSDYGKDGDGFIEKLNENYEIKAGATAVISIENSLQNFRETGFKSLAGKLDEDSGNIEKIDNEYDRLLENEIPQLSIKGRITPTINKWVYDDESTDVRDNLYRLTNNSAFSYDNFSPSSKNIVPDFRFYTHEWYYLQKYPPYLTTEEKLNTFSYFEEYLDINDIKDNNEDKFIQYFTQYKVDGVYFPKRFKYSIFSGGNDTSDSETFFRGAKIKAIRRIENERPLNFNLGEIGTYASEYFNDYKFSTVLTNDTLEPTKFTVVENKKWKTITLYIEANIDDYYFNRTDNNELFLDRCCLYTINDKYSNNGEFSDVNISGAISPYKEVGNNLVPSWEINNKGNFVIPGFLNTSNNTKPSFDKQIQPTSAGRYNRFELEIDTNKFIIIDGIVSVTEKTIECKQFFYRVGGITYQFTDIYKNLFPTFDTCVNLIGVYLDGGYNYYNGIIQDISFGSIFDKVNNGSPDIIYETVELDGTITNNTFLLEFDEYTTNAKADYITTEPIIFNGIRNNGFKPIGSNTTGLDKTYISTMFRFNGNYNPKSNDIIFFREEFGNLFNEEIRNELLLKNVQLFSTYPDFALYKQQYLNKVNEQNPLTVLDLSSESALKPEFWKINEIALDKKDSYLFRSCWDINYYNRYTARDKFDILPGYIEPAEVSSLLASTIMNIPDSIKLEKYTDDLVDITRNSNNVIEGTLNNTEKITNIISPNIQYLFDEYVSNNINFQNIDTFEDDINRYIQENILVRYTTDDIIAYVKYNKPNSGEPLIESNMTEQELLQNGFILLENINFKKTVLSEFDISFVYNKPSDKDTTLAFVSKIIVE